MKGAGARSGRARNSLSRWDSPEQIARRPAVDAQISARYFHFPLLAGGESGSKRHGGVPTPHRARRTLRTLRAEQRDAIAPNMLVHCVQVIIVEQVRGERMAAHVE